MAKAILLVDEKREVVLLLHSALDTLGMPELEILEAASGSDATELAASRQIDLLVSNSRLPDMAGLDLMRAVDAAQPGVGYILITTRNDRAERDELLSAGAAAVFNKPVPLGDFLDAVERGLGLVAAGPPPQQATSGSADRPNAAALLQDLRTSTQSDAAFVLNARGLVVAQSGELSDRTMEVSLIASLTASFLSGMEVARANRQDNVQSFTAFAGGDHDLVLVALDEAHALVLAARHPGGLEDPFAAIQAALKQQDELASRIPSGPAAGERPIARRLQDRGAAGSTTEPATDLAQLLAAADQRGVSAEALDEFWDQAAVRHADKPLSEEVITYDEARKRGIAPDREQ